MKRWALFSATKFIKAGAEGPCKIFSGGRVGGGGGEARNFEVKIKIA